MRNKSSAFCLPESNLTKFSALVWPSPPMEAMRLNCKLRPKKWRVAGKSTGRSAGLEMRRWVMFACGPKIRMMGIEFRPLWSRRAPPDSCPRKWKAKWPSRWPKTQISPSKIALCPIATSWLTRKILPQERTKSLNLHVWWWLGWLPEWQLALTNLPWSTPSSEFSLEDRSRNFSSSRSVFLACWPTANSWWLTWRASPNNLSLERFRLGRWPAPKPTAPDWVVRWSLWRESASVGMALFWKITWLRPSRTWRYSTRTREPTMSTRWSVVANLPEVFLRSGEKNLLKIKLV